MKTIVNLLILAVLVACQASGGGAKSGGIISGHTVVDDKFTLTTNHNVTYQAGETITFHLAFPIDLVVSGSPRLRVTIGSTLVYANYVSENNGTLRFDYVVQSTDFDNNGIAVATSLDKNGGSILYQGTNETSVVITVPSLSTVQVNGPAGAAPVANNITPAAFNEDTASTITLSYTDSDGDLATSCSVGGLNKVTVTTPCSCNGAGVCTVGVTGATNQNGAAGFTYTVTAAGGTSNTATASFTLNPVADAPVANNITVSAFNEDTIKTVTLSYSDGEGDLAVSCTTSALNNVTVTTPCACAAGVCTVSVQGTANYNGAASFGYTVTANTQTSNVATASLTITGVNDAPVATNITPAAFNEDIQSVITLAYSDADNDKATACSLSGLTNVTVTQACACNGAGVCTVGVTGTSNYYGAAGFNFTVTAAGQTSAAASATLTINPVDDAPVASNITPAASVPKNVEAVLTLVYTDVESHLATSCAVSALNNVTVTTACSCAAGTCTVGVTGTPLNYTGAAGFSYTVTANGLTSNTATATFNISGGTPPVADDLSPAAFNEDVQSIITLSYSDGDSDKASACTTSALSNVTVTQACACNGAGVCTVGVTGTSNYYGAASFDYTVTANSDVSNTATATLTINPVDDAPVATNITPANIQKNQQGIMTLAYTDVESHQATTCAVSGLSNITETQACACAAGVCTVGVTGTLNYTGSASFNFTVTANGLTSNSASSSFNIVSSPPVATNITPPAFNEDIQSVITLAYTDADNDLATSCSVTGLTNVTATQACACAAGVCTVGVTGTSNYNGSASFNYTVTAAGDASTSASATLTINPVDDAPVATNITPPSFAKNIQSVMTLAYTDVESDLATTCSVSSLSNVTETQSCSCSAGTCTVGVTGTSGYSGAASFNFTVTSNGLTSNSATSTFTITNTAPVANSINPPLFNEDTQSIITLSYSDADTDLATACSTSSLSNVTVTQACACNGAGVCTVGVTGTSNYNGSASFGFTVTAAGQTSNTATANLSITAVDDAPTGVPLTPPAFNEDVASSITLTYSDVEGDQATSCSVTGATNISITTACTCTLGTCTVGVTGTSNYYGSASFNYTVTANGKTSASQPASLTITSVPDAPTTANLTPPAFNEDTQSIITLTHTVVGGDTATSCAVTSPTNVTVTQVCACAAGTCTVGVTGTSNYNGAASFNWTVSSGSAQSVSRSASLTINAVDDAASLGAIAAQTTTPNTATGAIAFTFNDPDGAVCNATRLSMTSSNTTVVANGSVTWGGTAPNCTATITPVTNKAGSSSITITATDGGLASKTTVFTLNVNGAVLVWTDTSGTIITSYDFADPTGNTTYAVRIRNDGNQASGAVSVNDGGATQRIDPSVTSCATIAAGSFCSLNLVWTETGGGGNGLKTETITATNGTFSAPINVQGIR